MEPAGLDFALMVFKHTGGAEHAYADAVSQASGEPWAQEIAFVEHHQRDRIVVRGTFAGHYVDADDEGDFIGRQTAEGAIAGGAAGLLFGPAGLAVGMVAGGMAGGSLANTLVRGFAAPCSTSCAAKCRRGPPRSSSWRRQRTSTQWSARFKDRAVGWCATTSRPRAQRH